VGQILVLAEQGSTRHALLTLAARIGDPVVACCGPIDAADTELFARHGVTKVFTTPCLAEPDTCSELARSDALVAIARRIRPTAILIAAGREGGQVAARVAVRLDAGIITDAVDVYRGPDGLVAVQEACDGRYAVRSSFRRGTAVITVATATAVPALPAPVYPHSAAKPGLAVTECIEVKSSSAAYGVRVISRTAKPAGERPDLATAPVVVAGGRGVGSAETFELIGRVAAAFGGAVGGTQTAADQGWCPQNARIDQTGTSVRPRLYLACGISGSVRHRAGMQHARTIVAIDRDPAAPIFRIADYGVIGDLRRVLPALLAEIARRRGSSTGTDDSNGCGDNRTDSDRGINVDDLTEA
jgi:electron transfer flavoprotein alpha subunit